MLPQRADLRWANVECLCDLFVLNTEHERSYIDEIFIDVSCLMKDIIQMDNTQQTNRWLMNMEPFMSSNYGLELILPFTFTPLSMLNHAGII